MIIKKEAELLQNTINKPENQVCVSFDAVVWLKVPSFGSDALSALFALGDVSRGCAFVENDARVLNSWIVLRDAGSGGAVRVYPRVEYDAEPSTFGQACWLPLHVNLP